MDPIEIQEKTSIRIGSHVYRSYFEENPKHGFHIYSIEAYGRPDSEYQQKFHLGDLTGIFAKDLPESFSLSIYDPRLRVKCIDGLWVQKHDGRCEITLSFLHHFKDWHFSQNLHHFYQDLRNAILKNPPYPSEVSIDKDEYGLSAFVKSQVNNQEDIGTHIFKMASYIDTLVEEQTLGSSTKFIKQEALGASGKLKPDEDGWKWWVRYVVVPLGVASAATLLAFAFKSLA